MALPPPVNGPGESTGGDRSPPALPKPPPPAPRSDPDLPAPSLPPPTATPLQRVGFPAPNPDDAPTSAPPPPGLAAADGPLRATERLRRIATLAIWTYTVLGVGFVVAVYRRLATVDAFFVQEATGADLDRWDLIVSVVAGLQIVVLVGAAIAVAMWSSRSVGNAEAMSGSTIGTAMAAVGWFIPIGNMWLPFAKLRAAARGTGGDHRWVSRWQAGWIALIVAGQASNLSRAVGGMGETEQEFRDALATEAGLVALAAAVTVVAAWLAHRAMCAVAVTTAPTELRATDAEGRLVR